MWWRWMAVFMLAACATGNNVRQPHPYNCNKFYSLETCGPGLQFNEVTARCELPNPASCENGLRRTDDPPKPIQMVLTYAHPTHCQLYYRIVLPLPGPHFSPELSGPVFPKSSSYNSGCPALVAGEGMTITPATCTSGNNKMGDTCWFYCAEGFQLKGSQSIFCTDLGWDDTLGLGVIPFCQRKSHELRHKLSQMRMRYRRNCNTESRDVGRSVFQDVIAETNGEDANLLFLIDESNSITKDNFKKEVRFVKALVSVFPLSSYRSAGVILFSDKASVPISLKTNDTCTFLKRASELTYHDGGTNLLLALRTADEEIRRNRVHKKNLVFLITDGGGADPTSRADILKRNGYVLFTIGVEGYDRNILESIASERQEGGKLFYGISDFAALDEVAKVLETKYSTQKYKCS